VNAQGEDVVSGIRTPEPLKGMRARLPDAFDQLLETMERLDNIESLARITLLSVPEWCGSAYTDLERRITALEDTVTPKRVRSGGNYN